MRTRMTVRYVALFLALVSAVVFVVEIGSARDDATPVAQAAFVAFVVLGAGGWWSGRKKAGRRRS